MDELNAFKIDPEKKTPPPPEVPDKVNFRLVSLCFFLLGLVAMAAIIGWPIYKAHSHVQEIWLDYNLITMATLPVLAGFYGMVFGKRALKWFPTFDQNVTFVQLVVLGINVAIIMKTHGMLESYLESIGYVIKRS
jgi:hypothetical protein